MKKFLSFLTLLVAVCSGAWADDDPTWSSGRFSSTTLPSTTGITLSSDIDIANESSYGGYVLKIGSSGNNTTQNYLEVLSSSAAIEKVAFLVTAGSNGATITPAVLGWSGDMGEATNTAEVVDASQSAGGTGKKKDESYIEEITYDFSSYNLKRLRLYRQVKNIYVGEEAKATYGNAGTTWVWGVKVWLKSSGPAITSQPVGASYATGQTIAALTVAATASAGNLSYQWYSCDDANKTNAAAITNATSSSYTPTGAGFYYVKVTDGNGSVDSEVVEISISAATAPTINVSDAPVDAVKVGTEVVLTATATGVPTPALQWYSNTTASNTGGTAIDGATSETYAPSTAAAGTFYFYATATNSKGTATSAVQTIVVKEQVATPTITPNGAYFETSKEVTLACTTDGATIKYSTDNGATWTDYTTALNLTETTTVQAKATKDDYIDSEVATATFTKFTKSSLVSINGAKTWTIPTSLTLELKNDGTTFPAQYDEYYTYADIATINNNTLPNNFDGTTLAFSGQYPYRGSYGSQNGNLQFITTVPGTLTVEFSNTGGSNNGRWVKVNNTTGSEEAVGTGKKTEDFYVSPGTVTITHVDTEGNLSKGLRIYSVTFTPKTSTTVAVGDKLYRTFASKWPLTFPVTGLTAYRATVDDANNVTFTEVTGNVPAGEGLLLKATAADTYTINVPGGEVAPIDNALVGVTKETTVDGAGIFVLYDGTQGLGFYKTTAASFTVSANTAYLPADITTARTFIPLDEEATGIAEIEAMKNVGNEKFYNLNGQRVAQPTKGLYIVNGKKVMVK